MFGICIVTYGSEDVITDCLDSLLTSRDQSFRVMVLDNASRDGTVAAIRDWSARNDVSFAEHPLPASGTLAPESLGAQVTLALSAQNLGFAGGVNCCLRSFLGVPEIDYFWVLNPDSEVTPDTLMHYRRAATEAGDFALLGGRTLYLEAPQSIQSDGGRVNKWTGICSNVNQGWLPTEVTPPGTASLDFISGANVVASRAFLARAGLMRDDYFLYFEEVDWAQRRGDLPLAFCAEAIVYHHGGTAIGSGAVNRRPTGFANYFNYRNRMKFVWRFRPYALPVAYGYSMLKIVKLLLLGAWDEARGAFYGLNQFGPPAEVRNRVPWPPPRVGAPDAR